MILPIFSFNSQKPANINFQGRLVRPANEIKNLDRLTCPVCGGPIIAPEKLVDAYRAISLPLKSVLKSGFLEKTKGKTGVWEVILNFAKQYPKESLDKILESEKNHDAFRMALEEDMAPGVSRDDRENYEKYLNAFDYVELKIKESARRKMRSSAIVIKRLKPLLSYFKKIEKAAPYKMDVQSKIGAYEELACLSDLYPKKRISEILSEPSVKEYITIMKTATEEGLRWKQKYYFGEIRNIIFRETPCTKKEIVDFVNNLKFTFMNSDNDPGARVYNAKQFTRNFLAKNNSLRSYRKIEKLINEIPESIQNKYTVIYQYLDSNNDSKIIDGIFRTYTGTTEHVFARSTGGGNYRANVISMHMVCNSGRSNKPYTDEIKYYPAFPKNMCKQIKQSSEYIFNDRMDRRCSLYLYPPKIKETLALASEGAINPDVTDYCEKSIAKFEDKIRKTQKEINRKNYKRDELIIKLRRCGNEEEKAIVRAELDKVLDEQKTLIGEIKRARYYYNSLKGYLKSMSENHQ